MRMTTLEEMAELDEARHKCSGSSSPRSIYTYMYSQEMIFWISFIGREGIPGLVAFEAVIGSRGVAVATVSGREDARGVGLGRGGQGA